MKKLIAVILCAVLLFSVAACGGPSNPGTGSKASSPANSSSLAEQDPPGEEPPVISVLYYTDLDAYEAKNPYFDREKDYWAVAEKAANVKLDVQVQSGQGREENLQVLLASSNLPDVIKLFPYQTFKPQTLYANKQIYALSDFENCAPNYMGLVSKYPTIMKNICDEDGNVTFFAQPCFDIEIGYSGGVVIRRDWLEKLGLDVPETLDEFLDVMRAFRDKDPNGNGIQDEVPFFGDTGVVMVLTNFFGVNKTGFAMHGGLGGEVVFSPLEVDRMKAALRYLNTMYKEGLINDDYLVAGRDKRDTLINAATIGATFCGTNDLASFNTMKTTDDDFLFWPVPALKYGDEQWFEYTDVSNRMESSACVVTTSCEHPEAAFRYLDYFFSEEGHRLFSWGVEGIHYELDEESDLPRFADFITNDPNGLAFGKALEKYNELPGATTYDDLKVKALTTFGSPAVRASALETYAPNYKSDYNLAMPNLSYTDEEADEYAALMGDINTYLDETISKFVTGQMDVDTEYDTVVQTLKDMGAERALEINRDAHKRWLEKAGIQYKDVEITSTLKDFIADIPLTSQKGAQYLPDEFK